MKCKLYVYFFYLMIDSSNNISLGSLSSYTETTKFQTNNHHLHDYQLTLTQSLAMPWTELSILIFQTKIEK